MRFERLEATDFHWCGVFPYLRFEPLLVRAYEDTGDLDRVAAALRNATWQHRPVDLGLLAQHVSRVARRNGWTTTRFNGDVILTC